jgi:hypothetical protein
MDEQIADALAEQLWNGSEEEKAEVARKVCTSVRNEDDASFLVTHGLVEALMRTLEEGGDELKRASVSAFETLANVPTRPDVLDSIVEKGAARVLR